MAATISLSTVPVASIADLTRSSRRPVSVSYISGLNSFSGLKARNKVSSLELSVCTDHSFAKIVSSLREPSNGKKGGALTSTCNATGEFFQIAAIMSGLTLVGVGVAVGFASL